MKLHSIAFAVVMMSSCGAGFAATSINCRVNAETGAVEATSPWRNSLGAERADSICKASGVSLMPLRAAAQALPVPSVHLAQPAQMTAPEQIVVRPASPPMPQMAMAAPLQAPPAAVIIQPSQPTFSQPAQPAPQLALVPAAPLSAISAMQAAPAASASPVYAVSPSDVNFRRVLTRWSRASGWTFDLEHWAVSKDIPVGGTDSTNLDFKSAVRRLLKSTLLNDTPVQPCFYSNKVLRVIPATELCSRSET